MVKLRLRRMGRKKAPVYDIVAADTRYPRDGRFIEKIGQYNPKLVANQINLKRDRALYWLTTGAQPTDTVRSLLSKEGVLLELHLNRKGKDQAEIAQQVENHLASRQNREAQDLAAVAKEREQRRRDEEEAARKREEEEKAAAEAAAREAEAAAAAAAAEAEAANAPAEEAPAEEAPAAEAQSEEAPAAEAETPAAEEAPAAEATGEENA